MLEELDRDRPLFNDAVAVQVKFPDHDKTLALTVRVLEGSRTAPGGSGGGLKEGVLHIEITDEIDPFFLYTLQVGSLRDDETCFEFEILVRFRVVSRHEPTALVPLVYSYVPRTRYSNGSVVHDFGSVLVWRTVMYRVQQ